MVLTTMLAVISYTKHWLFLWIKGQGTILNTACEERNFLLVMQMLKQGNQQSLQVQTWLKEKAINVSNWVYLLVKYHFTFSN